METSEKPRQTTRRQPIGVFHVTTVLVTAAIAVIGVIAWQRIHPRLSSLIPEAHPSLYLNTAYGPIGSFLAPAYNSTSLPCPVASTYAPPMIHLTSGRISSGKSSLSRRIEASRNAVVYSPDTWILYLYGRDYNVSEFTKVGSHIMEMIWYSAQRVLVEEGRDVVLDFSFWFRSDRDLWRNRIRNDSKQWFKHCRGFAGAADDTDSNSGDRSGAPTPALAPAAKVRLYHVSCPLQTSRERLILRNRSVQLVRRLLANGVEPTTICDEKGFNNDTEAGNINDSDSSRNVLHITPSTSPSSPPSSSSSPLNKSAEHINEMVAELLSPLSRAECAALIGRSMQDVNNFDIELPVFEAWWSLYETPTEEEHPVVVDCLALPTP